MWREKDGLLNSWVWKADFRYKKKRYRPTEFTKADLEDVIIAIKSNANRKGVGLESRAPRITLGQLLGEHIRDFDLTVGYYRRGKVVLEMFAKEIGKDVAVEELATSDIKGFVRFRRSQNPHLQNSSINKDLTYVSALLSSAHEYFKQLKDYNPPKLPWEPESTRTNPRVIYKEESQKLLEYLRYAGVRPEEKPNSPEIRGDYADMYELAMNTTMRWGEVAQIEWSMVNLRAREITLPKRITKTDEARTVPLNSRTTEIMALRYQTRRTVWVFPRADGKSYRKYYYDRLRSIAKKIGLPFGRDVGFTLHTTRHTAITEMQHRGADLATIQQISGHSDRTIALRYSHSSKERIRHALESLVEK